MIQEPKYDFQNGRIINRASGEVIPEDEPTFTFRARDRHALAALIEYHDRVDPSQQEAVLLRIHQFNEFREKHPDRMKNPDTDISTPGWS